MSSPNLSTILNAAPGQYPVPQPQPQQVPTLAKKIKLDNKYFDIKSDIKPWLHRKLAPFGIDIVIERSDDTKIVFKCKYIDNKKPTTKSNTSNTSTIPSKRKTAKLCPFRIRSNYSIRLKLWTLVIVNDNTNKQDINFLSLLESIRIELNKTEVVDTTKNTFDSNHTPNITTSTLMDSSRNSSFSEYLGVDHRHSFDNSLFSTDPSIKRRKISNESNTFNSFGYQKTVSSSTSSIPSTTASTSTVKSPVYSLLNTDSLFQDGNHIQTQVRRIEDTLKDLEKFSNIPTNSKEQIYNNVLNVLNSSITQAKSSPSPPQLPSLPLLPPLPNYNSNYDNNKITLPSIRFN